MMQFFKEKELTILYSHYISRRVYVREPTPPSL